MLQVLACGGSPVPWPRRTRGGYTAKVGTRLSVVLLWWWVVSFAHRYVLETRTWTEVSVRPRLRVIKQARRLQPQEHGEQETREQRRNKAIVARSSEFFSCVAYLLGERRLPRQLSVSPTSHPTKSENFVQDQLWNNLTLSRWTRLCVGWWSESVVVPSRHADKAWRHLRVKKYEAEMICSVSDTGS